MDKGLAQEGIECLPRGKTGFAYFKDRYACLLLSHVVKAPTEIAALRDSPYARLLRKPVIKGPLAERGDGRVVPGQLRSIWREPSETFLLTLAWYEGEQQTDRRGGNLVLQLNFSNKHRRQYLRLIKPKSEDRYIVHGHPVLRPGQRELYRDTLAWARMDLDLATGKAMAEYSLPSV